jgi:hypothetical protein
MGIGTVVGLWESGCKAWSRFSEDDTDAGIWYVLSGLVSVGGFCVSLGIASAAGGIPGLIVGLLVAAIVYVCNAIAKYVTDTEMEAFIKHTIFGEKLSFENSLIDNFYQNIQSKWKNSLSSETNYKYQLEEFSMYYLQIPRIRLRSYPSDYQNLNHRKTFFATNAPSYETNNQFCLHYCIDFCHYAGKIVVEEVTTFISNKETKEYVKTYHSKDYFKISEKNYYSKEQAIWWSGPYGNQSVYIITRIRFKGEENKMLPHNRNDKEQYLMLRHLVKFKRDVNTHEYPVTLEKFKITSDIDTFNK